MLLMFAGVLSGRDRLAFRDVGYFYTPLYQWVADLSHEQTWGVFGGAIWNPLDQTGMPLAGETTTAVFYPLRILVYTPHWSAKTAMAVYVVLHLIIASLTAYYAARCIRSDAWSACVAGLVYSLSGIVLFSATNPPFLVGASWLPLIVTPLLTRKPRSVWLPAVAMALVILGGDPPTVFHAVVVVVAVLVLRTLLSLWQRRDQSGGNRQRIANTGWRLTRVMAACVVAALLSMPQLAASFAWSSRSDRVRSDGSDRASKIEEQAYAFSVPPWRTAEFMMPNLYGSPWAINTRWDRMVFDGGVSRPETALWTPTLYCGVFFPVLVLARWARSRSRRRYRRPGSGMSSWYLVFLIGICCAFGAYGPGYWLRSLLAVVDGGLATLGFSGGTSDGWISVLGKEVSGQWGGPFWFLHEFVPGYDSLRYPAKWLPFAALAAALITATEVRRYRLVLRCQKLVRDEFAQGDWGSRSRGALTRSILSGLVPIGVLAIGGVGVATMLRRFRTSSLADPFWGPFDVAGACDGLLFTVVHLSMLIIISFALRKRWASAQAMVALVAIDLVIAHHGLVPTIDRTFERNVIQAAPLLADDPQETSRWMRVHKEGGFPQSWKETSNVNRMGTVEAGLRRAWFGRWHLENRHAVVNNMVSIGTREMTEFWLAAKAFENDTSVSATERWRAWCQLLGVSGYLRMGDGVGETVMRFGGDAVPEVAVERFANRGTDAPVHWADLQIHAEVATLESDREAAWQQVLGAFLSSSDQTPAFVSPGDAKRVQALLDKNDANQTSRRTIVSGTPMGGMVVGTGEPVFLSRRVYQDGNWRVRLTSPSSEGDVIEREIVSVDLLSQGFVCPAGRWRVSFEYDPWWYTPTLLIAFASWIVAGGFAIRRCRS
ncbi:putative membrane protein [Rhodopirellula sallentina SM41]|uniref:Putative membrane protein n=1 Tax=Rhodopirellula sallentina SM41 TaxID=1263870 RepID=M5U2J3_9BACT|nr:putative membrane protein [Rhodopirellula sallentina SM41]